jgi:hypothetical protein
MKFEHKALVFAIAWSALVPACYVVSEKPADSAPPVAAAGAPAVATVPAPAPAPPIATVTATTPAVPPHPPSLTAAKPIPTTPIPGAAGAAP